MKVYEGRLNPNHKLDTPIITVNGQALPLMPSLKVANHSPTGFAWGYAGSGPAQLALAILLDHFNDDSGLALEYYMDFKWQVIARWPQDSGWIITGGEIEKIIQEIEKARNGCAETDKSAKL